MNNDIIMFIIAQAVFLFGIGIGAYLKIMTRLKEFEIRIGHAENQDKSVLKKLDFISEQITDLRVNMENKQNRE